MPIRLLAALLLGLFSLLPAGCPQQHFDAHPLRATPVTAPAEPSDAPADPADALERHCVTGEAVAPAQRSVRSTALPAPCPVAAPAGDRAEPAARRPTASDVRSAGTPGPRGLLLATGRWRI
ncbi:hypothetical protein ACFWP2_29670 [Kitasatospora sp. NPDC058444]|uniref:hypothetical protein n=1 Tax=Kitasatospora sp. NPDC058444 TaxID=3346504 RepID=UPI003659CE48